MEKLIIVLVLLISTSHYTYSWQESEAGGEKLDETEVSLQDKLEKRLSNDIELLLEELFDKASDEKTVGQQDDLAERGGFKNELPSPGKHFYIESALNKKVVEIPPNLPNNEGVKIQMWDKRDPIDNHQLWVVGEDFFIRSLLERNMEFTNSTKGSRDMASMLEHKHALSLAMVRAGDLTGLEMHYFAHRYHGGKWTWNGAMITNSEGQALTIRSADPTNGARLTPSDPKPEIHKKWKMVVVDDK